MSYIIQSGIVKAPRIKADKTATLNVATLYEMDKEIYNLLNNWAFDDEEIKVVIVKPQDWVTFIQEEASKLLEEN